MLYDCKRISYWIDRRLTGLAGSDYDAPISFGLPLEPEDSQYGKPRLNIRSMPPNSQGFTLTGNIPAQPITKRRANNDSLVKTRFEEVPAL